MNEVISNILNRRSVRVYSEEQIKQEDLDLILQSGLYAPSACNTQSWHFTVIQNKEFIKKFSDDTKEQIKDSENEMFKAIANNDKYDVFYEAPTVIVVSGQKDSISPIVDCSAAIQNMLLAAESLDIGSCWIGFVAFLFKSPKGEEYIKSLEIPQGYEPYYAVTLGYKKYPNPKPKQRIENTVNYIK